MKVSVVVTTFRPGYIDTIAESLSRQTMSQDEWELILVDDLFEKRRVAVADFVRGRIKNFRHIPPRELKDYSSNCMTLNTGIVHSRGELVYFSNDYLYPSPGCLQRHWQIYTKYGPKVIIHGPLIDAIVASGRSVWRGTPAQPQNIVEKNEVVTALSFSPPIPVPLKDGFNQMTPENFISVFKEPFIPPQFLSLLPDWRTGATLGQPIDTDLYENGSIHPWSWWWAGRNTSAPLEMLLEINGFDESFDGRHGGADGDIGYRLMHIGGGDVWREDAIERTVRTSRYLVDAQAPAFELTHPVKKGVILSETERLGKVEEARAEKPIPNDYSLREERERILKEENHGTARTN